MKYLGIDYGEKNIGLAIGDNNLKIATPFGIVHAVGTGGVLSKIKEIIKKEKIDKIIIGLPLGFRGETEQTRKTRQFASALGRSALGGKNFIEFVDERFTSKIAKNHAGAAAIILQDYLDMLK